MASETVVVGIDESADARLALEYAAQEAARRRATLRVVTTFESSGVFGDRHGLPISVSDDQIAKSVEASARKLIGEVVDVLAERPKTELVVKVGDTGIVLVEQSASADLLVVGHRGRGLAASAILGSVGLYCVLHAQCTVAVVRPPAKAAG